MDAKNIAADALNLAEYDVRKKYKANRNLTSGQLGEFWILRMNFHIKSMTSGSGRVGKTGAQNTNAPTLSRPYSPC